MALEIERTYEEVSPGIFKIAPKASETLLPKIEEQKANSHFRKIKPNVYQTFLKIKTASNGRKVSFKQKFVKRVFFLIEFVDEILLIILFDKCNLVFCLSTLQHLI